MKKLDGIVDKIIRYQLSQIRVADEKTIMEEQHNKQIDLARAKYRLACMQLPEKQRELEDYRAETIRVIQGESRLNIDLLNSLVSEGEAAVEKLSSAAEAARLEFEACAASGEAEEKEYRKLQSWADLYEKCSFEAKKMIACQFIKSVYVYRDYTLEIEFNVSFEEFKTLNAECEGKDNEEPAIYVTA